MRKELGPDCCKRQSLARIAFSSLRLNSFDTSQTGDELRGNENDTELEGELPGVRRRLGGDGTFAGWKAEVW